MQFTKHNAVHKTSETTQKVQISILKILQYRQKLDRFWGPTGYLFNAYQRSFLGVKRPERESWPSISNEVKNKRIYTSVFPYTNITYTETTYLPLYRQLNLKPFSTLTKDVFLRIVGTHVPSYRTWRHIPEHSNHGIKISLDVYFNLYVSCSIRTDISCQFLLCNNCEERTNRIEYLLHRCHYRK